MISPQDALRPLDAELLNELLNADKEAGPYVSLYMPTHRRGSDTRENGIRFRTLLKQAADELGVSIDPNRADKFGGGGKNGNPDAELGHELLRPLFDIKDDNAFWQHQLDGLAVFRSRERLDIVRLGRPVQQKVAVADSYHVKPLVRILQTAGRYQLLAVTQKSVRLYEGDLDTLDEVPLHADVPNNIIEALGGEVRGELNVNHYGGMSYNGMFHGHHDNKDDRDVDLDRFFRVVDKAVYDYHGRGGDLPLYFAGDVDYHDRFFKASHHPRLVKKGVRINPDAVEVDNERLRKEMEDIIRPAFDSEISELLEQFGTAKAQQLGSDDLKKVAEAAAQGRIATLIVNGDKSIGGKIDRTTGKISRAQETDSDVDDVLDDLAEMTLQTGGRVRVIPGEMHPSSDGVVAIFRY